MQDPGRDRTPRHNGWPYAVVVGVVILYFCYCYVRDHGFMAALNL